MTKLAKYHDISAFCGKHDPKAPGKPKYAIDHVRFDPSVSHLQATDGHVAISVPVDDCDSPEAVIPAKRLATAANGGASFSLGKGGFPNLGGRPVTVPELKFPDVAAVASKTPDANLVFCLGVPVLRKLLDYAQANGADAINLAVSHAIGETRKDRVVKDPIRFFMQVNVDEKGETTRDVSGLLMPCLAEDRDVLEERLTAAIAATKTKAKPATKKEGTVSVAKVNGEKPANGKSVKSDSKCNGTSNGTANGKTHSHGTNGKPKLTKTGQPAATGDRAKVLSERALKAWATRLAMKAAREKAEAEAAKAAAKASKKK